MCFLRNEFFDGINNFDPNPHFRPGLYRFRLAFPDGYQSRPMYWLPADSGLQAEIQ